MPVVHVWSPFPALLELYKSRRWNPNPQKRSKKITQKIGMLTLFDVSMKTISQCSQHSFPKMEKQTKEWSESNLQESSQIDFEAKNKPSQNLEPPENNIHVTFSKGPFSKGKDHLPTNKNSGDIWAFSGEYYKFQQKNKNITITPIEIPSSWGSFWIPRTCISSTGCAWLGCLGPNGSGRVYRQGWCYRIWNLSYFWYWNDSKTLGIYNAPF